MENVNACSSSQTDSEDEADMFCPALPPTLQIGNVASEPKKALIVGPTLPPNYKPPDEDHFINSYEQSESEEEEDEDVIGPLPSAAKDDKRFNGPEMEYRLKKLIADTSNVNDGKLVRESWMLELPAGKPKIAALGLGTRQFRKKKAEDLGDRSVWTDTPEEKERKEKLQECKKEEPIAESTIEEIANKRRDEELASLVSTLDKKRSIPLVEAHKIKKAKKEESRPKERKPFSREEDMNVNKFDEAQKETILKKARQLNDRFSAGNRKFL